MPRLNCEKSQYINETFAQEDTLLKNIRLALIKDKKDKMSLSPYEGLLLQFFVHLIKAEKIIEIGSLYGYSALWMARALPPSGQLICLEKNKKHIQIAQNLLKNDPHFDKIHFISGDAKNTLKTLNPQPLFDMIFIDANKSAYTFYLDWAEKNIRPGGLIIGDNAFLFGHLTTTKNLTEKISPAMLRSMKLFNKRLSHKDKYSSIMIPTQEGMVVAQKF